jgi:hypothetical protein
MASDVKTAVQSPQAAAMTSERRLMIVRPLRTHTETMINLKATTIDLKARALPLQVCTLNQNEAGDGPGGALEIGLVWLRSTDPATPIEERPS